MFGITELETTNFINTKIQFLLLWKGRLGFKQYIPKKQAQFGIKVFFCVRWLATFGTASCIVEQILLKLQKMQSLRRSQLGKSGAVIPKLMKDLYGKGYQLYTDNWYTSGKLFSHLQVNGTAACGTEMPNRLNP